MRRGLCMASSICRALDREGLLAELEERRRENAALAGNLATAGANAAVSDTAALEAALEALQAENRKLKVGRRRTRDVAACCAAQRTRMRRRDEYGALTRCVKCVCVCVRLVLSSTREGRG